MLSCAGISMLVASFTCIPSMFNRHVAAFPSARRISLTTIFLLLGLCTVKYSVVEPRVVKTVSNVSVSVEKESLSAGLVVIKSFLQEERIATTEMKKMNFRDRILII